MRFGRTAFSSFVVLITGGLLLLILSLSCAEVAPDAQIDKKIEEESRNNLSYAEAAVLGVVEGLTEYLPVSSTGHLILTDHFLDKAAGVESTAKTDDNKIARNAYLVVIQGGAILAVFLIYWEKILSILMGLSGRNPRGLALGLKILVAFVPAALVGPFLDDLIEEKLFNSTAVCVALVLGALVMIGVEWRRSQLKKNFPDEKSAELPLKQMEDLSYRASLFIGVMQCFAMWPGMSRSMVTIVGGYLSGLEAKAAAEFSFMLGLLTLSAASCYSLLRSWDVIAEQIEFGPALFGILVATIVAFLAVKWFVGFLTKHGMIGFAVYRLILATVILWLFVV
jgi:undecaprenyl-diphosphatase